jgi:hypothetical protein
MRKKPIPNELETVVDQEILRQAKEALQQDRPRVMSECVICGGEAAPNSVEKLCWVCRRLSISAWRDSDQQMAAQE